MIARAGTCGRVSDEAYRLWVAMAMRAGDDHVFRADPRRLARALLGIRDVHQTAALLAELARAQLIAADTRAPWCGIDVRQPEVP